MSYLDRGHDGTRDDRARDRDGNLVLTVDELRAERAQREAKAAAEVSVHEDRKDKITALLPYGREMLSRVIADARVQGRRVDAWLAADSFMWFEIWFMPGDLEWTWSDLDVEARADRIQSGEAVPRMAHLYNQPEGYPPDAAARALAEVILDSGIGVAALDSRLAAVRDK